MQCVRNTLYKKVLRLSPYISSNGPPLVNIKGQNRLSFLFQ